MSFSPTYINLPLFLGSRNPFRQSETWGPLKKHISKKRLLYSNTRGMLAGGPEVETANQKRFRRAREPRIDLCSTLPVRISKISRELYNARDLYKIPPNRYDVASVPYAKFKGLGGAYWSKLKKDWKRSKNSVDQWKFYDVKLQSLTEVNRNNRHKGIFCSNARKNKPTDRIMMANLPSCCNNLPRLGPGSYDCQNYEIGYNITKKKTPKPPASHRFLRRSSVPVNTSISQPKNESFLPGPGRYENRYRSMCHCTSKFIYHPGIDDLIEQQKRLKFRRQPFLKIRRSRYCDPTWSHVKGKGHTYMFKNISEMPETESKKKTGLEVRKRRNQLYADAKYITMITNPERELISIRTEPPDIVPMVVRFHCMTKPILRKHLDISRKMAFMSSQERFKDSEKPLPITRTELEALKASLPPERQIRDFPIFRTPINTIKPKVYETLIPTTPPLNVELRKKPFRFKHLPHEKVLIAVEDLYPAIDGVYAPEGLYGKKLKTENFMKEGYVPREYK